MKTKEEGNKFRVKNSGSERSDQRKTGGQGRCSKKKNEQE